MASLNWTDQAVNDLISIANFIANDSEKFARITGTGIGLAIVKKIVENYNGFISPTSELNKGATFDIYIPN